jgi:GNAT superfamily N-acetyltransferase
MEPQIKRATPDDASGIQIVHTAVWPDGNVSLNNITQVLACADHVTHVATVNDRLVGFVDGFSTRSQTGVLRWEVDLLAVDPAFQGRGIATRLVAACTSAGQCEGVNFARALIKIDNTASERTFARCGYQVDSTPCVLLVSTCDNPVNVQQPPGLQLVPVRTLSYRGFWLEGELSLTDFAAAQHIGTQQKADVVGAVIPLSEHDRIHAATQAGYHLVGQYQWWFRQFEDNLS